MSASLMQQGFDLMLFGMGTVFVFLTLLVVSVTVMSSVIQKFFPEAEPEARPGPSPAAPAQVNDPKLIAILQAAIEQHRNK
ncbi:OadG family protein [uncultured Pseudoteredinibacter sp.]|uniref:OadG family protein n=1 Tax=uncultured Pseudoteredinibacter sp. TaxID=1641701 RepID=UPI0026338573|nr:OadG family protein [uncultured Pseudoteredinibacter sp.]